MNQSLFDYFGNNVTDTSKQQYKKIRRLKLGMQSLQGFIIRLIEQNKDGLCLNEIAFLLETERSTISARLNELEKEGILIKSGKRKSFITGQTNYVWDLTKDYKEIVVMVE